MAHDVFISYSSKDKTIANAICAKLEEHKIRAWIAPRDIPSGENFAKSIIKAINSCKVFVLIWSFHTNTSEHILNEINQAFDKGITIIPFRIQKVEPTDEMRYYFGRTHWLDAIDPPLEDHITLLKDNILKNLDRESLQERPENLGKRKEGKHQPTPKILPRILAGLLAVAAVATAVWFSLKTINSTRQPDEIPSAAETIETPLEEVTTEENEGGVEYSYADLVLCYPALGIDHPFYKAITASVLQTAKEKGIKQLVYSDAQGDAENQISAIRSCIEQGVSVIAYVEDVDYGWAEVLTEAKDAGIPVIIIKENAIFTEESLYDVHFQIDNFLQGQNSAEEMNKLLPDGGNIVEISGSAENDQAKKRAAGFRDRLNENITILDSQTGNWTRDEARPVMEAFLAKYEGQIDGMYIHNDDMSMGAIEAIKAAGIAPGEIKIVSIDGTREAFQAMIDGYIQVEIETNPMFGSQLLDIAMDLMNGKTVDRTIPINQTVYYPDEAEDLLPTRYW